MLKHTLRAHESKWNKNSLIFLITLSLLSLVQCSAFSLIINIKACNLINCNRSCSVIH